MMHGLLFIATVICIAWVDLEHVCVGSDFVHKSAYSTMLRQYEVRWSELSR